VVHSTPKGTGADPGLGIGSQPAGDSILILAV